MNSYNTFGDFIAQKRYEKKITVRAIAAAIGVSPGYYNDIEKGRRNPPDRVILDKMINAFLLYGNERIIFYDLAGKARSEVAPDLPEYIMENDFVRVALRLAKEKASQNDWQRFINDLENKQVNK